MIPADLHGTPAGHAAGCRGYQCLHHRTDRMTCEQARRLYDSDYGYRKAIDGGLPWPPPAPVAPPAPARPAKAPRVAAAARPRTTTTGRRSRALAPEQRKRNKVREHGTMSRYKGGKDAPKCVTEEGCPNHGIPGKITCRQANLKYAHDARERMKTEPDFFASRNHGTTSTYSLGCTNPERCPNHGIDGARTCSEARAAAVADRAEAEAEKRRERRRLQREAAAA